MDEVIYFDFRDNLFCPTAAVMAKKGFECFDIATGEKVDKVFAYDSRKQLVGRYLTKPDGRVYAVLPDGREPTIDERFGRSVLKPACVWETRKLGFRPKTEAV